MAYFEFSLENGYALIMPAGGGTPCGNNFVAGRDDVPFKVIGDAQMTIDSNNNVTICLRDMKGWIFPNKANLSGWFYYDTLWARAQGNCLPIYLDVSTSRAGNGAWNSGNGHWQRGAGWKGGTGIRGYDQWIKYAGDIIEPDCAGEYVGSGCCGAGSYIGSAKRLNDMCFNLGKVDFNATPGFWIGANLACYEGGWEQWQFFPWPIIVFDPPTITVTNEELNICEEYVTADFMVRSDNQFASGGGTWELQISQNADFSNALTYTQTSSFNNTIFSGIRLIPQTHYYVRARIKVSSIRYSNWATTTFKSTEPIPDPSSMVATITDMECFYLRHGILVEGGLV